MLYKQLTVQDMEELDARLEELRLAIATRDESDQQRDLLSCIDKIRKYILIGNSQES